MGDDPRTSVVDHLGRVWRSDEPTDPASGAGGVYEDLFILDGSIVPSSLGCNPLLTIAMLAERSMASGALRTLLGATARPRRPEPQAAFPAPFPPVAQPAVRREAPALRVVMQERLTCDDLSLAGSLAVAFPSGPVAADLTLGLERAAEPSFGPGPPDWLELWSDREHLLAVTGTLRLEHVPEGDAATREGPRGRLVVYRVDPPGDARFFFPDRPVPAWRAIDRLPAALRRPLQAMRGVVRAIAGLAPAVSHLLRALLTLAITRWLMAPPPAPEQAPLVDLRDPLALLAKLVGLAKQLRHACETRHVRYDLPLRLERVHEPTTAAARALPPPPEALRLRGSKRVDYAARWSELARWACRALALLRRSADPNWPTPLPQLRPSLLEQLSHLEVRLHDAGGGRAIRAPVRMCMDFKEFVGRLPLRLPAGGDLPSALAAMASYPAVIARHALQTRLLDLRLPEYSGRALVDAAPDAETCLRPPPGAPLGTLPTQGERIDFEVLLGASSSDLPDDAHQDKPLTLRLMRYRRPAGGPPGFRQSSWHGIDVRKVRSVLLVHAFAQSGYSFTLKTVPVNLAEALFHAGYEVWILEHRLSTRLPAHREQSTIDQVARHDIPAAVDKILEHLDKELNAGPPLQIFAFAQCVGAAATAMALLSGRLSHDIPAPSAGQDSTVEPPRLPKLAGLFISQTHPHCIGRPLTQARTWIPAFVRDALRRGHVPFAVREPEPDLVATLADRIFSALPVPGEEQCPPRRRFGDTGPPDYDEDDCATCRRLRFLEAPMFRHAQLNYATHRALPRLFGDANVRIFAHAAKCIDAERLVTEDGRYAYVHDRHMRRHMALPVCFVHGAENELFDAESALRSAQQYERIQPQWAARVGASLGARAAVPAAQASWLIPGYGHVDLLIGRNSGADVFPGIVAALDDWYEADLTEQAVAPRSFAAARLPRTGPLIGALRRDLAGVLRVSVSFGVDDRFSDGKQGCGGPAGSRTWAYARVSSAADPAQALHLPLGIANVRVPATPTGGPSPPPLPVVQRIAYADLRIDDALAGDGLNMECFSVHEALVGTRAAADDLLPLHAAIGAAATHDRLAVWLDALLDRRRARLEQLAKDERPNRRTVSYFRLKPERYEWRLATLSRASIATLAPTPGREPESVTFAAGTCRYPGFRFERRRVDRWATDLALLEKNDPPAFGLLLGDQIYADATAGFADPHNSVERYFERHRLAFGRGREGLGPPATLGDWLARLPVLMTPDDHEFHDAFPDGPAAVPASPARQRHSEDWTRRVASRAVNAFQQRQSRPLRIAAGAWAFSAGPVRVLVLDTRSNRRHSDPPRANTILGAQQLAALQVWLNDAEATRHLNILATGSVLLPGLLPDLDPGNPGPIDTLQAQPADRGAVLRMIAGAYRKAPGSFRLLALSGDYHIAAAGLLHCDGRPLGGCIVAPPLYSPMPFLDTAGHTLYDAEPLGHGLTLALVADTHGATSWRGSGMGCVQVRRHRPSTNAGPCYEVRYQARLRCLEQHEARDALTQLDLTLLL